jgi:hypothetical protein
MKPTHQPPVSPATDDAMSPAALLLGAAEYLRRYGHTQHEFFDLVAADGDLFPPACASGAIIMATYGVVQPLGILDHDDEPEAIAAMRAMRVFADYLDDGPDPIDAYRVSAIDVIGDWNDQDGRTAAEVIAALTDAAHEWQHTHTGGAR